MFIDCLNLRNLLIKLVCMQFHRVWYYVRTWTSSSPSSSGCSGQGQVLHDKRRNAGYSFAEGTSSTANSGTKVAVLPGMNRCGGFHLLSALHSLFSIWPDLKRSEKIPGAPTWRWGEWICLTGPSGRHRNSPQGLNINSITTILIKPDITLFESNPHSETLYIYTLIFNPCGEFRWSSGGPVSQIHSHHLHVDAPGIFSDLLRSVQILKRDWNAESNGKLPHLFSPW